MAELEEAVRAIEMDGLLWGACELLLSYQLYDLDWKLEVFKLYIS